MGHLMNKKTGKTPAILWSRRDLRLADNPARAGAIALGRVGNMLTRRRIEGAAGRFTFET